MMFRRRVMLRCWLLVGHGLCWGLSGLAASAKGDVLYFTANTPPVSGRLIEEGPSEIVFQTRAANGSVKNEIFLPEKVRRIIRTIHVETLEKLKTSPPTEVLAYAETLLAISHDLEAQVCGQELLTNLLARTDLEGEWKLAVERLQVQSLPPSLARARLQQRARIRGLEVDSPNWDGRTDQWEWYVQRLSEETRDEWLRAIRADRETTRVPRTESEAEAMLVPSTEIRACIQQTQGTLVVGVPLQNWMGELISALDRDDLTALATIARLEVRLNEK